ncbi:MAG: DUF4065 domain-containing protein, partial [Bacteroidales bacterium]|nr:DUF4065 domain-containing protein [Bacteroidales bacterium]
ISHYLIAKSDNAGDPITNKKLQKLLYYVKAWGLVFFPNEGIIKDDFEAWIHGPVCPEVYRHFKGFGYRPLSIPYDENETSSSYIKKFKRLHCTTPEEKDKLKLIDEVFEEYGQHTSLQLELLSHSERPWIEARKGLEPNQTGSRIIDPTDMKKYYGDKISNP